MGQKISPLGLRLGLHRKWTSSWFTPQPALSTATVNSSSAASLTLRSSRPLRGAPLRGAREERLFTLLSRPVVYSSLQHPSRATSATGQVLNSIPDTRQNSASRRLCPVDLRIQVGTGGRLTLFLFYARSNSQL